MKASEFDKKFENGESVLENVDIPEWMIKSLDEEAEMCPPRPAARR